MMNDLRAAKSGFAREVQEKINKGFDQGTAQQCMEWIKKVTGDDSIDTSGDTDSVADQLKNGIILNKLQQKIQDPTAPVKEEKPGGTFNWIERLSKFNEFIKGPPLNVNAASTFTPEQLTDKSNIPQVITCLQQVAMKCLSKAPALGGFGPKEAEANIREFSEEQLAQGKSVIGLQMGSNKGASQAGQIFGKSRMITD